MSSQPSTARSVAWLGLLSGSIVVLRLMATRELGAPPLSSIEALTDWTNGRDTTTTAFALVRFVAEATAWYLLGLSVLYRVAAGLRSGGMIAMADAVALPGARRFVRGGLGLGLVASTAVGVVGDETAPTKGSTAIMQPDPSTAWMVPETDGRGAIAASVPATPTIMPGPQATTWTVSEGESFWSIAEDVLATAYGRAPDDGEIDPFWRALIDANRSRLADPDEPDLIHAGQVFELPVAAPPA